MAEPPVSIYPLAVPPSAVRIVYVITRSDTLGGAHVHLADLSCWMSRQGHSTVVVVGGKGPYTEYLSSRGVEWISSRHLRRSIDLRSDAVALFELRRLFRELSPDLIALHSTKAGMLGRLAAVGLRVPVVFTAHGWSFTEGISLGTARCYRMLERWASRLADRIITVSHYDRLLGLDAGIGPPTRLVTVHNGLSDTSSQAHPGDAQPPVRIISVARLDRQKDHKTLFRALAGLLDYEWTLDLVGDGPLEQRLREEAIRLDIAQRVNFLGLRLDVAELLSRSHVFVLASNWEGFPLTTLEAMRAGLPVVSTAVGGTAEAIDHNRTGFLVQRADSAGLRDALRRLIEQPDLRLRFGINGRERFLRRFDLESMARATLAVYSELVRETPCASA